MERIMLLGQMIFFLVPIIAPSIGQLLLSFGEWRIIFYALAVFAAFVFAWTSIRLQELLPEDPRVPLSLATLAEGYPLTLTNRYWRLAAVSRPSAGAQRR